MRILMINSVCGIRSTGRICTDLAEVLAEKGHVCKIAYGRESVPEKYKKYAVRIGSDLGVKINGVKARLFDNEGFNAACATKKFIKWVKEYDPDVIHLHNLHGYYINITMLFDYIKESGKPVVWTLHDSWAFTGHCACIPEDCHKWERECYECHKYKAYPMSYKDCSKKNYVNKRLIFTGADNMTIVTPSKWLSKMTTRSFFKGANVKVVNNGIDLDVFCPTKSSFREEYGLENKKIVLGVASAWGKGKGLLDFFKLAEVLDEGYKIVLVGLTKEQLSEIPQNIIGITRTNDTKELAAIYTTADIFVNLTYNDNYPTVNLEAQACGTPVITYRTGGSVESVPDDCVIEQGNVRALAEKIIAGDAKCKKGLILDKKNMLEQYINIYNMIKK